MPGRPHLIQLLQRPLPLVVAGVLLSGCGGPLQVDAFEVSQAGKEHCQELLEALPPQVAGESRVEVEGSAYAVAWGSDDPIVLRCGVAMPADFTETSECNVANGIGWYVPPEQAADQSADLAMTTVHRSPAISVDLTAARRPPTTVMVDLASVIGSHTDATGTCR